MSDGAPRPGGLHHEQDGATAGAETVVLLHGGNLSGWMWAPQREPLADRHLLVPDLPGYGGSRDLGWVSTTDAADRVAELIRAHAGVDEQGRPRAHVVGYSLGASVAAVLVARHPEVLRSAVIASAPLDGMGPLMTAVARTQVKLLRVAAFQRMLGPRRGLPREAVEQLVAAGVGLDPASSRRMMAETARGVADQLEGLDEPASQAVPVLGVAGAGEARRVVTALQRLQRTPQDAVRLAPSMHHLWTVQHPDVFTAVVRHWVEHGAAHPDLEAVPSSRGRAS